jgi:hypothetical protein
MLPLFVRVTDFVPLCTQAVAPVASLPEAVTVYWPERRRQVPLGPAPGAPRAKLAVPLQLRTDPPARQAPLNVPAIVSSRFSVGWVQLPCATPAFDTALKEPVTVIPWPALTMSR